MSWEWDGLSNAAEQVVCRTREAVPGHGDEHSSRTHSSDERTDFQIHGGKSGGGGGKVKQSKSKVECEGLSHVIK